MKSEAFVKVLDAPNTPIRLKGKTLACIITKPANPLKENGSMRFEIDLPDDVTANEQGYVDWLIGEFVDSLRKRMPNFIGDRKDNV